MMLNGVVHVITTGKWLRRSELKETIYVVVQRPTEELSLSTSFRILLPYPARTPMPTTLPLTLLAPLQAGSNAAIDMTS